MRCSLSLAKREDSVRSAKIPVDYVKQVYQTRGIINSAIPVNPVLLLRDMQSRDPSTFLGLMGVLIAFLHVQYVPVLVQVASPCTALGTNHLPLVA